MLLCFVKHKGIRESQVVFMWKRDFPTNDQLFPGEPLGEPGISDYESHIKHDLRIFFSPAKDNITQKVVFY